jgi:DNA-binding transcriptional ArsR family regulator
MAIRNANVSARALDATFRALADPTRRGMLALVARNGECTASELGGPFRIAQPTASKHIGVLEGAGLVERRIAGREHRFRLVRRPLDEAQEWIARHQEFWEVSLARLDALLAPEGKRHG